MKTGNIVLRILASAAVAVFSLNAGADNESFSADDVKKGSAIYSQNCSPCHGSRMLDPQGAFDLRTFPKEEKNRFLTSVSKGKNQMPPWGGLLSPTDIEALWAYVFMGEK
jgi:mono/diheme cytochrome c family protein